MVNSAIPSVRLRAATELSASIQMDPLGLSILCLLKALSLSKEMYVPEATTDMCDY